MTANEKKINDILSRKMDKTVYCFCSTEEYWIRKAAEKAVIRLTEETGEESTMIAGPAPSVEEIVLAAGTISFFGTKRVVELPFVQPTAFSEKDFKEFCDVLQSTENAVFVITVLFGDEKFKTTKRAKAFLQQMQELGQVVEFSAPSNAELTEFVQTAAKMLDTETEKGVPQALVERCGNDLFLLGAEVEKLAAACGYSTITNQLVAEMSVRNVETDVFEMVRLLQSGRKVQAFERLNLLLQQQNEPIAITAALAGSYVDLYRVKCGQKNRKNHTQVHKDFAYKGSDWRLKKAAESAARLSLEQLEQILRILLDLDKQLKSCPTDKTVLLQTALAAIVSVGGR